MIMIRHFFKFMCVAFGIAGLVGCSNNGFQPVSLDDSDNSFSAKVGPSGATSVSSGVSGIFAVGKDLWQGKNHKIYTWSNNQWIAMIDYSMIDAWKVGWDATTNTLWIIATNKTLWRGMTQQFFTADNNRYGKTGPILAYDISLGQTEDLGVKYGIPYILINETGVDAGKYGYVLWFFQESNQLWSRYWNTIEGSGVAVSSNPTNGAQGGDVWIVRNDGTLWLWNCSNMAWIKKATNCLKTAGKADVSVAGDNSVYYLSSTTSLSDYKISISTNRGDSWTLKGAGIAVGAGSTGWMVNAAADVYKYMAPNWVKF
jgi:hypothetical protein